MWNRIRTVFRAWSRRDEVDREIGDEMAFHLEMETKKLAARGLPPEEARRQALLAFGGVEKHREECRDATGAPLFETLLQDARYGLRGLRRNPGFAAAAVLTLALGIGANTAIFSVIHGVFLQALPYEHGERIVRLRADAPGIGVTDAGFSIPETQDYAARNRTLQGLSEYHSMWFILLGRPEPERVQTGVVSANYFEVMGVRPLLGRTFLLGDDADGADPVLVLSFDYWMRSHGGDPGIVGRTFRMNDHVHTVVGVLPPMPAYPDGNDVYMPSSACPFRSAPAMKSDRKMRMVNVYARLKAGVSLSAARADLDTIGQGLEREYPEAYPPAGSGFTISPVPVREELTASARPTFLVLFAAVGLVLLLACANVGNLTLARLLKRQRELALRSALGASRLRLARQLLTESCVLSLAGGAFGLLLAWAGRQPLVAFAARFTPRAREIALDESVLLFALVVSVATGLVFGLIPVIFSRDDVGLALQEGGDRATGGVSRHRLRSLLIVLQVAVSFMLLIGAGLMIRSLWKLQNVDPGFRMTRVLTARLNLNFSHYKDNASRLAFHERILERAAALPGVASAAFAGTFPLNDGGPSSGRFQLEGRPPAPESALPQAEFQRISTDYFQTIGLPLVAGRGFIASDRPESPRVCVVSQTLARRFWGAGNAVGKRISVDLGKTWTEVVGVAGDVRQHSLDAPPSDQIYVPLTQYPTLLGALLLRASGSPRLLERQVRDAVLKLDPEQPIDRFRTLDEVRSNALASPRLTALLLGLFAAVALVVTCAGIAGVIAFSVSERTQEFGIRLALGAAPNSVLSLVLKQGMALVAAGLALGFVGAHVAARLMSGLLFEVNATDPPTFLAMSVVLVAVALVSCLVPARRATSVDPMIALRSA